MKNSPEDIAIIDIGSNSVRLFIFKIVDAVAQQVSSMKFFSGLGKDLGTTGKLNPVAVRDTLAHLSSFRTQIQKYNIRSEMVIGTAALREAKDASEFIEKAFQKTGFRIKIIEGEEEARLAALAILSTNQNASGVVADFGGGSLELALIGDGNIKKKVSLKLGAHYLKALTDRQAGILQKLGDALMLNPEFIHPETLYIIGGSWRSLAKAWLQDQGNTHQSLEGFSFIGSEITQFCENLQTMEPVQLIERYHMEAPRAELMDVSALMLEKLISELKPKKVQISTTGIRDGLAYDYILNHKE